MPALALTSDYADSRDDFLERARSAGAAVTHHDHPEVGPDGGALACDVAWLGPADAEAVVLVTSGTHGVEGYAGSALQRTWLRDGAPERPDGVAVALVHGLNPYGFAWVRRVNEDNVDLNRNFVDFEDPPSNEGYDRIADLLVPERWDEDTRSTTDEALLGLAAEVGFETFQQWVSGGQYRHPTGLFYGGTRPVWSRQVLESFADAELAGRRRLAVIDLHTGLGPWGHGELISSDAPADPPYRRAVAWYGDDVTSLVAGDSVSAELSGEWLPALAERIGDGTETTAVALEYGTVDGLAVVQALRGDAWLHAHGDPTGPAASAIKVELRAAFADDDPAWIARLHERFTDVLGAAFRGLA